MDTFSTITLRINLYMHAHATINYTVYDVGCVHDYVDYQGVGMKKGSLKTIQFSLAMECSLYAFMVHLHMHVHRVHSLLFPLLHH